MRTINCLLIDVSTAELQFSADVIPSLGYQMTYNRTIRKTRRRNAGEKREIFVSNKNKWEKRRKKNGGRDEITIYVGGTHTHTHGAQWNRTDLIQMVEIQKEKKKSLKHFSPVSQTIKRQWHKRWRKTLRLQCRAERLWEDGGSRGTAKLPKFLTRFLYSPPPFVLPFFSFSVSFFLHFLSLFFSPSLLRILLSNERYHSRPIPQTWTNPKVAIGIGEKKNVIIKTK